jgi:hypothetical protein
MNSSIKGLHEWEKIISETTLNEKTDMEFANSFVQNFKIRTVEKIQIWTGENKPNDTTRKYLLEYDTMGLLVREHSVYIWDKYCFLTQYSYKSNEYFIGKETSRCGVVDFDGRMELIPNVVKSIKMNGLLLRKELSIT